MLRTLSFWGGTTTNWSDSSDVRLTVKSVRFQKINRNRDLVIISFFSVSSTENHMLTDYVFLVFTSWVSVHLAMN